jgi:dTDP-4-amino-4,6-dideoxygalactose transaminase
MKKRFEFNLQYSKPLLQDELDQLISVAKSGLFSRYTEHTVDELEVDLAKYYQTDYAVTCTSGTAALHGCLVALDLEPGSEIITTSVADIGIVIPIMY